MIDCKEWFIPENLEKIQNDMREKFEHGEINNKNDFHSYRLLLEGKDNTMIESHNMTSKRARVYVRILNDILNKQCKFRHIKDGKLCIADRGGELDLLQLNWHTYGMVVMYFRMIFLKMLLLLANLILKM